VRSGLESTILMIYSGVAKFETNALHYRPPSTVMADQEQPKVEWIGQSIPSQVATCSLWEGREIRAVNKGFQTFATPLYPCLTEMSWKLEGLGLAASANHKHSSCARAQLH
jgi:hypothetical protein